MWSIARDQISAEWGAQRIKGLSIWKTLSHALRNGRRLARQVQERGGSVLTGFTAEGLITDGTRGTGLRARNGSGEPKIFEGDYFFSTMPVCDLVRALGESNPPANVRDVGDNLVYRDFITVGLLVNGLKINDLAPDGKKLISDNWIYIQEPDVLIGRLQVFDNWSPYMVSDPSKVWLGLEYFRNDTDALWKMADSDLIALGREERGKIGIIEQGEVLDGTVLRMGKTYPAYFGSYARFDEIRSYTDAFENLFLIGRNGMHKYNNRDNSMLTAMIAVDNIIEGVTSKNNLWNVNTEMDYHEEKASRG